MTLTDDIFQEQAEIEHTFAASAFTDPKYVLEICGWVKPEMLIDNRVRQFWTLLKDGTESMKAAYDSGIVPDVLGWVTKMPTTYEANTYALQISKYNYLASIGSRLSLLAQNIARKDVEAIGHLLDEMSAERPVSMALPPNANDVNHEFIDAVVKENRNILTGIPALDNNTGGLERQTLSVLAGRPSMGKSSMALQIARNAAGPGNHKAIFFSLEMSRVNLWARAACPAAGVTWMDVRAKRISMAKEHELLTEAADLAASYGDRLRIEDKRSTTDSIWSITANARPDIVFIDHLRRIKDKGDNETQRLGMMTERLSDMAKELDCHVMVLAQLNREVENQNDKRPQLKDLRDSGQIEENADQVFMLYRDSYYNASKPELKNVAELWIRKFRDGVRDSAIKLSFDEKQQWFNPINF